LSDREELQKKHESELGSERLSIRNQGAIITQRRSPSENRACTETDAIAGKDSEGIDEKGETQVEAAEGERRTDSEGVQN